MTEFRKILVATDFSTHSERALEAAITLARTYGAPIHLLHAFDIPLTLVTPYEVAMPNAFLAETRQIAADQLAAAEETVRAAGVEVSTQLAEAPAARAIARAAEETRADLIVMGTRGNSGLKHLVLGSVAERTLRRAPCSVLTVKTRDC
jgi:nucleotide-binding universal stress UspA family protein